jgi:hypothetical protein
MTELRSIVDSRPANRHYRYAAVALSVVVAGIHLFHRDRGLPRLVELLSTNNAALLVTDPRPLLFVLSAAAILGGVTLVLWGVPRKPVYLGGMVLMATYISGYFAWHMTGHGGFLPGRLPHFHGLSPVGAVVRHLEIYPVARVSKVAELLVLGLLALLYRRETDSNPGAAVRNQ